MSYVVETMTNLAAQTGFAFLKPGNFIMILVALVFLYLAIAKGYEPLLLVPISFGMLLVNLYPSIMEEGGLLHYFYLLDEWSILPSLIFLGVGALTDFGPLIANPASFLLGAAAQFGIYSAYFLAMLMGFNGKAAAAISIIGGADGPTSIFIAGKIPGEGEKGAEYTSMTMEEAKECFQASGDYLIVDVRRADEYAEGHIPGAINIANEDIIASEPAELPDKNQTIYVYCRSGNRSKQASAKLAAMGYKNFIEFGGILDWTGEIEK